MSLPALVVVGAGGLAREAVEAVRAINAVQPRWRVVGYLDDRPDMHGTEVAGVAVLGPVDAIADQPDADVLLATGRQGSREALRARLDGLGIDPQRYSSVVHPAAAVSSTSIVGPGSIVLAHCTLTASVTVGAHVALMPNIVLTHDVVVADYATLASGVNLSGAVTVQRGAYLGAGTLVREGVRIGGGALVGMGSVVLDDVPDGRLWFGVPARDRGASPGGDQ